MKGFFKRLLIFFVIFLAISEVFSRIVVDHKYFKAVNTYNDRIKPNQYDTSHADYLFIGSSRVPATINTKLLNEISGGKVAINGGRGYMTSAIHFQALKNKLKLHPEYLKNTLVFLEYSSSSIYTENFEKNQYVVNELMPHLILPHLDNSSVLSFLKHSRNSIRTKFEIFFLYTFASYRAMKYINEKWTRMKKSSLSPVNKSLVSEGGIRNDNIAQLRKESIKRAQKTKENLLKRPTLTNELLDQSSLAQLNQLIKENKGTLVLYKMPLHSIQSKASGNVRAKETKRIFQAWLKLNHIEIVRNPQFQFVDEDFPDVWHLARNRRDEFTEKLFVEIQKFENTKRK